MRQLKYIRLTIELLLICSPGILWVIASEFFTTQLFVDYGLKAFGLFWLGILLNKYTRGFVLGIIAMVLGGGALDWWGNKKR